MKPSKILRVSAKKGWMMLPGFRALTWKGVVYCKDKTDANLINHDYCTAAIISDFECHETIHVRQAQSTHDSWFCFYSLYVWQWIRNFPLFITGWYMPYRFIEFELEAVTNEKNHDYPCSKGVYQWKEFKKLSLGTRYKLAKQFNSNKTGGFKNFVREYIAPLTRKD